jgi:hypothetical protein
MLRKIFRLKRDDITGGLGNLLNVEIHTLHSSSNRPNYKTIKSMTGHVAWGGRKINTIFLLKGLKGGDNTKVLGIDGRIILKWILME